ncbi:hypothetical protein Gogos_021867 [Gossypium gossypioides]|uniref:CCHC-type domain-containing protein n=1 Tax=Gossypium gossypioides TaxID=34282 RepID=A0A7J9D645_GOSGO|nr:hypothetical protein [Gossypium gossypioides]
MSETLPTVKFMVGANFLGSNSGVSRAIKKVRTRPTLSPESKDLTVDGNGQKIQRSELPNASYKSMLIGASSDPAHIMSLIQLMDLENDFFFVRFHNKDDYNKTSAQLAVYVDLRKPLVSNVRINRRLQRIEYESLSDECFRCGHYGHRVDLCMEVKTLSPDEETVMRPQRGKVVSLGQLGRRISEVVMVVLDLQLFKKMRARFYNARFVQMFSSNPCVALLLMAHQGGRPRDDLLKVLLAKGNGMLCMGMKRDEKIVEIGM